MPDGHLSVTTDDVAGRAVDAAMRVLYGEGWPDPAVVAEKRARLAEALDAASEVYAAAETAEVDRMLDETGLVGMEAISDGVRIRLKHAHDLAAGMVSAFDALIQQRGAENYVEWEFPVTDPATEQASQAGLPPEQWPPHRRYTFIVVRPGGKTPHQLRREAEQERDELRTRIAAAHDALNAIADLAYRAGPGAAAAHALTEIQVRARRAAGAGS